MSHPLFSADIYEKSIQKKLAAIVATLRGVADDIERETSAEPVDRAVSHATARLLWMVPNMNLNCLLEDTGDYRVAKAREDGG